MRILIADDSAVSRTVLERMLVAWGYEVEAYADGNEAWAALQEDDAPRLAILDWVMPGMDGIDVCRKLRDEITDRHTFVYLLTAKTSNEDVLAGLDAGADDYLTKPVSAPELRIRLRNGKRLVELHEELITAREALRTQAMVDPLTQVWNRRAFMDVASKELSRARRSQRSAGLLMIDLDHFKSVNDTHGHPAGDAVLAEAARRIQTVLRDGDQLARFGGEEFVVLLAECNARGAWVAAERVRREVSRAAVQHGAASIPISASIGAAAAPAGSEALGMLIDRADRALYEAKRAGRNRTVLAAPTALDETGT